MLSHTTGWNINGFCNSTLASETQCMKMVGLNRESLLNELFWTFSSWPMFSEASRPVPELVSFACGSGVPPPHLFLRKDLAAEPSPRLSWTCWLSVPEVYSLYPSRTSLATFFSLLMEIWRLDQWVCREYIFFSLQFNYLLPHSFSFKVSPSHQSLRWGF